MPWPSGRAAGGKSRSCRERRRGRGDDLAIYGGFNGTETLLGQREFVTSITRLSGDIGMIADASDNSLHVVTAVAVGATAVLDGFEITGGNADVLNTFFEDTGGGLRNAAASPTIANCSFLTNAATTGGGMHNANGSGPIVTGCAFVSNTAGFGALESQQLHQFAGATVVHYSTVTGWTGTLGGTGDLADFVAELLATTVCP